MLASTIQFTSTKPTAAINPCGSLVLGGHEVSLPKEQPDSSKLNSVSRLDRPLPAGQVPHQASMSKLGSTETDKDQVLEPFIDDSTSEHHQCHSHAS